MTKDPYTDGPDQVVIWKTEQILRMVYEDYCLSGKVKSVISCNAFCYHYYYYYDYFREDPHDLSSWSEVIDFSQLHPFNFRPWRWQLLAC